MIKRKEQHVHTVFECERNIKSRNHLMSVWYAMCLNSAPFLLARKHPVHKFSNRMTCMPILNCTNWMDCMASRCTPISLLWVMIWTQRNVFARTSDFDQEVLYGTGEVYGDQLQSFGTTKVTHQMLMVNPDKGRLFFRARLALGAGSAPEVREEILWEASKAYEALSAKTNSTQSNLRG